MRLRTILALSIVLTSLPLSAAITGSLMTAEGQPVAGATLTLSRPETVAQQRVRLLAGAAPAALATVQSDEKGAFSVEAPKGETVLDVRISASGYAPLHRSVVPDDDLGALVVTKAATKNGVVRAAGKPVAGATVVWSYASGGDAQVVTDEQGRYGVPDPAKAVRRVVVHPDYAIDTQVARSTKTIPLDATLVAGSSFRGRALSADRKPVPAAEVFVDGWPVAKSGEDGTFTIPHLSPSWRSIVIFAGDLVAVRYSGGKAGADFSLAKAATLAGTVTDAKSRAAIAGARVTATPTVTQIFDSYSVFTDAKGRYSLMLPAGTYRHGSSHPMYADLTQQVEVTSGATASRDRALSPLAVVSGTVTDEQRKPIAAAAVGYENVRQAFDGPPNPFATIRAATRTAPDGRYAMRVPESEVRITAAKKGLPGAKSDAIRFAAGEKRTGINLVIPAGFAVTGKVVDGDGRPLSGVSIGAAEAARSGDGPMRRAIFIGMQPDAEETVSTGADGAFSIRLKEGSYDLVFKREGLATVTVPGVAVAARTAPVDVTMKPSIDIAGRVTRGGVGVPDVTLFSFGPLGTSQTSTEADGSFVLRDLTEGPVQIQLTKMEDFIRETRNVTAPATNALIELPSGGRVSGRVIDKATRAPVTSFQAGISGSRGGGGMMIMAPPQLRTITSEDGSFVLDHVPPGVISIMVNAPGYVSGRSPSLTLEEGKFAENVEVELDRGVRLVGRVTGPDGAPVSGASVREIRQGMGPMTIMPGAATTDGSGDYAIEAMDPGTSEKGVAASKTIEFTHRDFPSVQKSVTLSSRETRLDAQFTAGPTVTGIVVNESGIGVPDATVRAQGAAFGQARTESDGTFRFTQLKPGRYTFTATAPKLAQGVARDVDITTTQQVRITLTGGATIYGRITGLPAAELARVTVSAFGPGGSTQTAPDASGNYRLEGVAAGRVRVGGMIFGPGGPGKTSKPVEVEVAVGESRQVDLDFDSSTVITGRVTRAGQPLASATVQFRPRPPAQTFSSALTDEKGVYSVSGLENGDYTINVVDMQQMSPAAYPYTVHGSGTFDIDIKSAKVRGRVINASNGEPVPDPRIQLRPESNEPNLSGISGRMGVGDSTGIFMLDYVAPGRYTAVAEKEGFSTGSVDVTVSEESTQEIEIKLVPTEGVRVRLIDERDGKAVTGGVMVRDSVQNRVLQGQGNYGNPNGELTLYLPPGSYTAVATANGYASKTFAITVPSSQTQTVAMSAGGTIEIRSSSMSATPTRRGRLLDSSGNPFNFGWGWAPFPIQSPVATLRSVAPGSYTLQIVGEKDAVLGSYPVTVVAGQTTTINIQ